ncbi:hypothetical protein D2T32_13555 [Sinirhodobacter populi]|nr:hypothetical protein D2T32_13555 [Sinirhodobacter populi]
MAAPLPPPPSFACARGPRASHRRWRWPIHEKAAFGKHGDWAAAAIHAAFRPDGRAGRLTDGIAPLNSEPILFTESIMTIRFHAVSLAALCLFSPVLPAHSATLGPAAVLDIGLTVSVTQVGTFAAPAGTNNYASPVTIGDHLYIVNQRGGTLSIHTGDGTMTSVISPSGGIPAGVSPTGANALVNIAGADGRIYVAYTSSTLPTGFANVEALPEDPKYGTVSTYQLVYSYTQQADGSLTDPQPLAAFETSTVSGGHFGGGMLVLPDGNLLIARGDNLGGNDYGGTGAQAPDNTVAKLLIVDGTSGEVTVAATGVRNVQQLIYADNSRTTIAFADIGWRAAEEINVIDTAALIDTATVENFGWGIASDGLAREGTFYVGYDGTGTKEQNAAILGEAPLGEEGFLQPYAQFTREGGTFDSYFASSGPIASDISFSSIGFLFADLGTGNLFATLADASESVLNDVYKVWVQSPTGALVSMYEYLGNRRPDLRFFTFADGSVGAISERFGTIYRIAEVSLPAVPLPATGGMLLSALAAGALMRRRARR